MQVASDLLRRRPFDTEAEEAAGFYTSIFKDSRIVYVTHYTEAGPRPAGTVMTVEFELDGEAASSPNGPPKAPALSRSIRWSA